MADRWSKPSVVLHWLTAALIVGLGVGGFVMSDLPADAPGRLLLSRMHSVSGMALMALTVARLAVRRRTQAPSALPMTDLHRKGVNAIHGLTYALTFALGATGVATAASSDWPSYIRGELEKAPRLHHLPPRELHEALVFALLGLVALHVVGTVVQQVRHRDAMRRMIPLLK